MNEVENKSNSTNNYETTKAMDTVGAICLGN